MSVDESDYGQEVELDVERRPHVPYILNGELYRIENQIGDNVTVKCCHCPPDRIYRGSVRSTGNFHMHIKVGRVNFSFSVLFTNITKPTEQRRHSSLLGKLHEMKVAALVERRDRIMKNRRLGKARKKLSPRKDATEESAGTDATAAETLGAKTHELKIKTVFQRHKQEQEGAASRSVSEKVRQQKSSKQCTVIAAVNETATSISTPCEALLGRVKPEQPNNFPFLNDQPKAVDLSRAPSLQSDAIPANSMTFSPVPSSQISQPLSFSTYLKESNQETVQLLSRTMSEICQELRSRNRIEHNRNQMEHNRNQIEHNRLMLEAAKFKFLNPNFQFEPSF
ncbi:hypothetical protein KR009_008042 [Drosophila setifemur]|nr:hypothetical protein KR009_008042 [Drosophila setifemur]